MFLLRPVSSSHSYESCVQLLLTTTSVWSIFLNFFLGTQPHALYDQSVVLSHFLVLTFEVPLLSTGSTLVTESLQFTCSLPHPCAWGSSCLVAGRVQTGVKSKRNVKVVKVNRSRDVPASVNTEKVSHYSAGQWNADPGGTRSAFDILAAHVPSFRFKRPTSSQAQSSIHTAARLYPVHLFSARFQKGRSHICGLL